MSRARVEAHLAFWHKEPLVPEELTSHHFQVPDALNHDSSEHVAAIRTVPLQRQGTEGGGTRSSPGATLSSRMSEEEAGGACTSRRGRKKAAD